MFFMEIGTTLLSLVLTTSLAEKGLCYFKNMYFKQSILEGLGKMLNLEEPKVVSQITHKRLETIWIFSLLL